MRRGLLPNKRAAAAAGERWDVHEPDKYGITGVDR
jgi:hypothetical protein